MYSSVSQADYSIDYEYYEISPENSADIKTQAFLNSDVFIDGNYYLAKTKWSIQSGFTGYHTMVGIGVKSVELDINITYVMPRLATNCCGDDIVTYFNEVYEKLELHEKGHGQIAIDSIPIITKYLMATPPQEDFKTLKAVFYQRNGDIISQFEALSNHYDDETNHGYTQGAYFK